MHVSQKETPNIMKILRIVMKSLLHLLRFVMNKSKKMTSYSLKINFNMKIFLFCFSVLTSNTRIIATR